MRLEGRGLRGAIDPADLWVPIVARAQGTRSRRIGVTIRASGNAEFESRPIDLDGDLYSEEFGGHVRIPSRILARAMVSSSL
jgi:hypothetical protein